MFLSFCAAHCHGCRDLCAKSSRLKRRSTTFGTCTCVFCVWVVSAECCDLELQKKLVATPLLLTYLTTQLCRGVHILESASFACPETAARIFSSNGRGLGRWMVATMLQLAQDGALAGQKKVTKDERCI